MSCMSCPSVVWTFGGWRFWRVLGVHESTLGGSPGHLLGADGLCAGSVATSRAIFLCQQEHLSKREECPRLQR